MSEFKTSISVSGKLEKLRFAVRETGVSRHNGDQIRVHLNSLQYDSALIYRGVSGGPELGPHDTERRSSLG